MLIGLTFGVAFLLRQNLTGIWLSIIIFIVWRGSRSGDRLAKGSALAAIFLGFTSIVVPSLAYFAAHSALRNFLDAVFRYNFAYSATSLESRLRALSDGLRILLRSGISLTAVCAWIGGGIYLYLGRERDQVRRGLVQLALIAFPIELAIACVSGRSYPHYYMAWLPVFAVLTGFFAYGFISGCVLCDSDGAGGDEHGVRVRSLMLLALLITMSGVPIGVLLHQMSALENSPAARTVRAAVEHIERVTKSGDRVLIWGAEPSLNFLSRRKSPSRYSFQYPLYTRGYQSAALVKKFLDDLSANEPALIIDTSPTNTLIPPIDPSARAKWASPSMNYGMLPEMGALFEFITSRYRCCGRVGPSRWPVYARKNATRFGA